MFNDFVGKKERNGEREREKRCNKIKREGDRNHKLFAWIPTHTFLKCRSPVEKLGQKQSCNLSALSFGHSKLCQKSFLKGCTFTRLTSEKGLQNCG